MSSKMEACAECSRSCTLLHTNKLDPNPTVSSFFKIMYYDQFSEVLFVPPNFTKTVRAMEGKRTYLEDATGRKWQVKVSRVDGYFAIKQGWPEFSVDHGIALGDILVFHYFKGSHFVVQIYGKSGCEKLMNFNGKDYQKKRDKRAKVSFSEKHRESSHKGSLAKERLGSCMNSVPDDVDVVKRQDDVNNVPKSTENDATVCMNSVPDDVHVVKREDDIDNVPKSTEPVPDDVHAVKRKDDVNNVPKSTENNGANVCMSSVPDDVDVDVVMRKDDVNNVQESTENGANVEREETTNKESCLMTDRNASFSGEDGRKDNLLDRSIFEKSEKKPVAVNVSSKASQAEVATLDGLQCEMAGDTIKTSNEAGWPMEESASLLNNAVSQDNTPLNINNEASWPTEESASLPNNVVSQPNTPLNINNEDDWLMEESASLPNNVASQANTMKTIPVPHKPEFSNPATYCQTPDCERMEAEPKSACHNAVADKNTQKREMLSATKDHNVKSNNLRQPSTSMIDEKVQKGNTVIPEVIAPCDSSPKFDTKMICSVKNNSESYLELPNPLPVKTCKQEAASSELKKLIFLRDPVGRLWPVVYHKRKGLPALAYGWKEFSWSNSIQPGDKCNFVVENANKNIFQVQIFVDRSSDQSKTSVR